MTRQSDFGELSRATMEMRDPALDALRSRDPGEPVVMLHAGRFHPRWATRSVLARPQAWYRYTANSELGTRNSELVIPDTVPRSAFRVPRFTHNLWSDLRTLLNDPNFHGRWIGYFSYDIASLIEPTKLAPRSDGWPLVELAWCPEVVELPISDFQLPIVDGSEIGDRKSQISTLKSDLTRPVYESAVLRVLDYIAAGDAYQVNLSRRLTAEFSGDPRQLYHRLATISPAWYGAYLELGTRNAELGTERAILSTSPELFLRVKDRHVITRPIKGTRPNLTGSNRSEFTVPSSEFDSLLRSEKDTAELNMIVDLMRNDLGRVCSYGSVRVTEPRTIETHPTVHHGVATIEGELHESKDVVDLLRATLPAGSITGAPKVRAMQIIDELEPHPRGPLYGAIGMISKHELQLSVAIRTMLLTRNEPNGSQFRVDFRVGGGIVADSTPAAEYEETLTKARAMLAALGLIA